jgi:uncharacterized BrkB/YihY/UPF0761 family membrane protein
MVERDELRHAGIGSVVTVLLSFTGFSALLGGAIAGYLHRVPPKRAVKTGALSGGIAVIPTVAVLATGIGLAVWQPSALALPGPLELAVVLLVTFPLLFAWIIGLSAVGGYVGASLRSGE